MEEPRSPPAPLRAPGEPAATAADSRPTGSPAEPREPSAEFSPAPSPSPWQWLVLDRRGEVRLPWRLGFWLVVQFLFGILAAATIDLLGLDGPVDVLPGAPEYVVLCLSAVAAAWVVLRLVDRRRDPFRTLGVALHAGVPREVIQGLLLGGVLIGAVWLLLLASGMLDVGVGSFDPGPGLGFLATLLFAATLEELLFRGYLFQLLADAGRPWVAVLVTSVLFGLAHNSNPGATLLSAVNTSLAGVLLAVLVIRARSLWLASVAHFSWNATMGVVLGLPVSGLAIRERWLESDLSPHGLGTAWWSGGSYGPEGGLVLTVVVLPLIVWLARTRWIRPAPGARLLWQREEARPSTVEAAPDG